MLIKSPVRHPGNFIGDARKVPEFWYIFSNRGYTVDCSLDFPDFGGIKCMPPPNLPLLHLHALEMHHSFMNNTCLGSELINMGMHILRTNVFCISSLNLVFNPAHWWSCWESDNYRINVCPPVRHILTPVSVSNIKSSMVRKYSQ